MPTIAAPPGAPTMSIINRRRRPPETGYTARCGPWRIPQPVKEAGRIRNARLVDCGI